MKSQFKHLSSALIVLCILMHSCTDEAITPAEFTSELSEANEVEANTFQKKNSHKRAKPGQITQTGENSYLLSWIIEDQVVILKTPLKEPVISMRVKNNRVEALYLMEGGLTNCCVYEDNVLVKTVIEDNIILMAEDLSELSLRFVYEKNTIFRTGEQVDMNADYVFEDHVILLHFFLRDKELFSSSMTIREDIL